MECDDDDEDVVIATLSPTAQPRTAARLKPANEGNRDIDDDALVRAIGMPSRGPSMEGLVVDANEPSARHLSTPTAMDSRNLQGSTGTEAASPPTLTQSMLLDLATVASLVSPIPLR